MGKVYSETVAFEQFSSPASLASALGASFTRDYVFISLRNYTHGLGAQGSANGDGTGTVTFQLNAGTSFGPITVTGSNTSFIVDTASWPQADPSPSISSVVPFSVPVGGIVIVGGLNFGEVPGTVTISGIAALQVLWTNDAITITVPAGVAAGAVTLTVTTSGQLSASHSLTIAPGNQSTSCPVLE